jgi:uncharacterized membrane protein YidH (DUF202 family)
MTWKNRKMEHTDIQTKYFFLCNWETQEEYAIMLTFIHYQRTNNKERKHISNILLMECKISALILVVKCCCAFKLCLIKIFKKQELG